MVYTQHMRAPSGLQPLPQISPGLATAAAVEVRARAARTTRVVRKRMLVLSLGPTFLT